MAHGVYTIQRYQLIFVLVKELEAVYYKLHNHSLWPPYGIE